MAFARASRAAACCGRARPRGGIPTITEQDFEQEVLRAELPVLLEFSADWCQPCKQIAPEVEAFAKEMEGKVIVRKVDIDKSPLLARELRIQSVPTFMVFAQGRPVDAVVGAIGKKKLREMVDPFLPRAEGALKAIELAQLIKEGASSPSTRATPARSGARTCRRARHMPLEEIEDAPRRAPHAARRSPCSTAARATRRRRWPRSSQPRACP